MSEFFIRRPIVAMVISIIIVIVGVSTLLELPIESYPQLAPPTIRVQATYPGASAEAVEQSVATPIEQQVNGVENMIYMKSTNTSDGRLTLDVTFDVGTDLDIANVLTQNRVSQATSRLPQAVNQQGVTIKKVNTSMLMLVSLYSPDDRYDMQFLNNYAMINVREALLRVQGISQVDLMGAEYGMRVWLEPDRLATLGVTPSDVIQAIREQNIQAPAGKIGAAPSPPGQEFTWTVRAPGTLMSPAEFEEIIVRQTETGADIRVRDVGRVELGGENYLAVGRLNGKPAGLLAIYLVPGANQLESASAIYTTLEEMRGFFPEGVDYEIVYDTTPAVKASINEIVVTFFQALALVILVVWIFLQNFRATLIPLLAIPVSLIGTFIFFPILGFTINTLTMFGLVLAIGVVVDDAIVVVEAVSLNIENGMSPIDATSKAMKEVTGPVIGTTIILIAVFVPVAFIGGLTGRMYQQFALTIAASVCISSVNALTLSPALSSLLLRKQTASRGPLGAFFRWFNLGLERGTSSYMKGVKLLIRRSALSIVAVAAVMFAGGSLGSSLRTGFVPTEDQGVLMANVQLPNAASAERTDEVMRQIEKIVADTPGISAYNSIVGYSMLAGTFGSNYGALFCRLEPWEDRTTAETSLRGIIGSLQPRLSAVPEAVAFAFVPPTIPGFGASGGFSALLQDRSGSMSAADLNIHAQEFIKAAAQRPEIVNPYTSFDATIPQLKVDLDREKARTLGVPIDQVFATLQSAFGGAYVNDFNRFGRLYRVFVQADASYRTVPEDLGKVYVRSQRTGRMIPLSTLITVTPSSGAEITTRYNLFRSVEVSGGAAPGYSSGQAMRAVEEVAAQVLPREMGIAWSGMSYQEDIAPSPTPTFILAIVFVFLILAALYESWKMPFGVLLGTPTVILGAFLGIWLLNLENNIYVQIGMIMLIGLCAKTAILIVEFAKQKKDEDGLAPVDAAELAAKLRFRPVLMTAFSFVLGVTPLIFASGSGAVSRIMMGVTVFSGMLVATILGVFLTPAFFVFIEKFGWKKKAVDANPMTEVQS